jgi:hypothetical protein
LASPLLLPAAGGWPLAGSVLALLTGGSRDDLRPASLVLAGPGGRPGPRFAGAAVPALEFLSSPFSDFRLAVPEIKGKEVKQGGIT